MFWSAKKKRYRIIKKVMMWYNKNIKSMVKVNNPFLGQKASGKLAGVLQYRCGKFVLFKPKKVQRENTGALVPQRKLFRDGAKIWRENVTSDQKKEWENFSKYVFSVKGRCFGIQLPGGYLFHCFGQKDYQECVQNWVFNGYQYFISCYLMFGPDGWLNYPSPPTFPF